MFEDLSVWGNVGVFSLGGAIVWAAGTRVARYADAIQRRTGMGEAVAGMLLLGLITALPEVAVTVTASHAGNATLADAVYRGGPALAEVDRFGTFAALLAIAVTALFIAGLLERRHAKVLRMGVDSLAVIGTYLAGVAVLYRLK